MVNKNKQNDQSLIISNQIDQIVRDNFVHVHDISPQKGKKNTNEGIPI